jgi:hypothetical protein
MGWGRQTTVRRGRRAPASNLACGKAGNRGEKGPAMMPTSSRAFGSGRGQQGTGGAARQGCARAWR